MPEEKIVNTHRAASLGLDFKNCELTVAGRDMNGF